MSLDKDRKIALLEATIKEFLRLLDSPHPDITDIKIDEMFDSNEKARQAKDIIRKARTLVNP